MGSLGITIFAPVVQVFLDTYGWRGAVLLLGGIYFHIAVAGALLRPINQVCVKDSSTANDFDYTFTSLEETGRRSGIFEGKNGGLRSSLSEQLTKVIHLSRFSLFRDITFLAVFFVNAFFEIGYTGWVI